MKPITRKFSTLAALALATAALLSEAQAAPVVAFSGVAATVPGGNSLSFDIVVSGLTAATPVGAAGMTLTFNPSFFSGTSYMVDPDAKMGVALNPGANDLSLGFGVGMLDLNFLDDASFPFANNPALFALEGASFRLAKVTLLASSINFGTTNLNLSNIVLGDSAFANTGANTTAAARTCVLNLAGACPTAPVQIPEPATMLLVASALAGLTLSRKQRQRA